jgi:hypothetical protein
MRKRKDKNYLTCLFRMVMQIASVKSTLKTTAAVLRSIAQEKDVVWAEMLGKSVHTIRHLEAGTLKLSATLAAKMNYETGISIKWLMDEDETAPPVAADGTPYTKKIYDNAQARKKYFATVKDEDVRSTVWHALRLICAILVSANRKRNYHLAVYRTAKALAELRDEFGEAKDFDDYDTLLAFVMEKPFAPLPEHEQEIVRRTQQWLRENRPANLEDLSKPKSKQPSKKRRRR